MTLNNPKPSFQDEQLNSRRFPVFPEGVSNSSRFSVFPGFPEVVTPGLIIPPLAGWFVRACVYHEIDFNVLYLCMLL